MKFSVRDLIDTDLIEKFPGPLGQAQKPEELGIFVENEIGDFLKCLLSGKNPNFQNFLLGDFPTPDPGSKFVKFLILGDLFSALNLARNFPQLWPFSLAASIAFSSEAETRDFVSEGFAKSFLGGPPAPALDPSDPRLRALAAVLAPGENSEIIKHWKICASICAPFAAKRPFASKILFALAQALLAEKKICEAQVCYLLASPRVLEPVDSPTSAIALLGADHTDIENFRKLLDPKVFILSEIFEFAMRGAGKEQAMPALQPFKYAFACLLADFGFVEKASKYMSFLAAFTRAMPASRFSASFRANTKDFEKRLAGPAPQAAPQKSLISGLWGLVG